MSLKTVYFDVGNVLVFVDVPKMISQIAQCTGMTVEKTEKVLFNKNLREPYEKGLIHTEQLAEAVRKESRNNFSTTEFIRAFSDIFTPNTELWTIVKQLKNARVRLILLSNTSECHFRFIESHYPIIREFDQKILSYEIGTWKPELRIFQKALECSQCKPEECFYTDDIPEFIASARKVGLPGEIFLNAAQLKQNLMERGCRFPSTQ